MNKPADPSQPDTDQQTKYQKPKLPKATHLGAASPAQLDLIERDMLRCFDDRSNSIENFFDELDLPVGNNVAIAQNSAMGYLYNLTDFNHPLGHNSRPVSTSFILQPERESSEQRDTISPPLKRPRARSLCSSQSTNQQAGNRWTEKEEVFLAGIVLDVYYRRHSLKATHAERADAKAKGLAPDNVIWAHIQERYEVACKRHEMLTGERMLSRTATALQKHWKDTKKTDETMIEPENEECDFMPKTRRLERMWEEVYNADHLLTCSVERFNHKIGQDIANREGSES